jgi:SEC-C motif-containing protein
MEEQCPCGSTIPYAECCGPVIAGERPAATAEQVMRARYSAYVKKEMDYILSSLHPDHRGDYDEKSTRAWAEKAVWQGLRIVQATAGGEGDEEGQVEFIASFSEDGVQQDHHELATFSRAGGAWHFVTGEMVRPKPVVRDAPKVGRNDPCPCGSGKKYKKCCG